MDSSPTPAPDLSAILDAIPGLIGYWDADQRNRVTNRAYRAFFGLGTEPLTGRHLRDVLGPDAYALSRARIDAVLAGELQRFDRTLTDLYGVSHHTQTCYVPEVVDGTTCGFTELTTELSEHRPAEVALAEERERFRTLFESVPIAALILGPRGRIVDLNQAATRLLGRSREELTAMTAAEITHPEDRDETIDRLARVDSGELDRFHMEKRFLNADGETVWTQIDATRLGTEDDWRLVEQIQDITQRRQTDEALRRSRARLTEAERVAQIGSFEWDIIRDHRTWSDGMFQLHGLSPDQFDPTRQGGEEYIYPEDRQFVADTIDRAIRDRTEFSFEYRALRVDGRVRHVYSHGEVVVNDLGTPCRLVGIARDITDAKLAQAALQHTSADLARRAGELERLAISTAAPAREPSAAAALTARQLEILGLIADGLTNAAIADRLILSEAAIKWHVKQILAKTGAANRAEAVARTARA
jgi:PAS domain S-box-containing protein